MRGRETGAVDAPAGLVDLLASMPLYRAEPLPFLGRTASTAPVTAPIAAGAAISPSSSVEVLAFADFLAAPLLEPFDPPDDFPFLASVAASWDAAGSVGAEATSTFAATAATAPTAAPASISPTTSRVFEVVEAPPPLRFFAVFAAPELEPPPPLAEAFEPARAPLFAFDFAAAFTFGFGTDWDLPAEEDDVEAPAFFVVGRSPERAVDLSGSPFFFAFSAMESPSSS